MRLNSYRTALVALVFAITASPARADIIVTIGVDNTGTDNVLLNDATDVTTVTGTVDSHTVNFESTGGLLNADASGQAVITPGTGNDPFNNIAFYLADGDVFLNTVFNINSATDGSVVINVQGININGGFFEQSFVLDDNGQNFFTINAINLQYITKVTLTGSGALEFEDLRQVRIGGIQDPPDDVSVPEPASMLLFGMVAAGAAIGRRRQRR